MKQPVRVCLMGAECTGKSTLAQALAAHFGGLWVPEYLRAFCDRQGRTPTIDTQLQNLPDAGGFLTLKDRSKDLIISGGSNIYPREVEEVLLRHPGVREVSVIGQPDPEWGEVVVAIVVGSEVTAAALDALCLEHIARFKRPKRYHFVAELPKNNYGKVLKTALRELLHKEEPTC